MSTSGSENFICGNLLNAHIIICDTLSSIGNVSVSGNLLVNDIHYRSDGAIQIGNSTTTARHTQSVVIGKGAMSDDSHGATAVGYNSKIYAYHSVAIGCRAKVSNYNTNGGGAVAIGLNSNARRTNSICIGNASTANAQVNSINNIAIGTLSLTGGTSSIAIGALSKVNADQGIGIGGSVHVPGASTGSVAIGQGSGSLAQTAVYNVNGWPQNIVALGVSAHVQGSNGIAIGTQGARVAVNNEVLIGTSSFTSARVQPAWSSVSDIRDKCAISPDYTGLSVVRQIQPKKFKFDHRDKYVEQQFANVICEHSENGNAEMSIEEQQQIRKCLYDCVQPDGSCADTEFTLGFIAQELQELENAEGIQHCKIVDATHPETLAIRVTNLIPICINAIKQLDALVQIQSAQIANLTARLITLENQ